MPIGFAQNVSRRPLTACRYGTELMGDALALDNAIRDKTLDLTARIDESGPAVVPSVDLILTSPTRDLRKVLRESGDARGAFSEEDQMRFHKK
jgi:hypothetical protein